MMLVGPGGSCPQAAEVRKRIFAGMWWCAPTPIRWGGGKHANLWAVLIEERCRKGLRRERVDL
jgi:hypothetical protein